MDTFKNKFYGTMVTSSQINQRKGLKTINIFEKTQAKTYAMPKNRGWKEQEQVPTPMFVNLQKVADKYKHDEKKKLKKLQMAIKSDQQIDELPVR